MEINSSLVVHQVYIDGFSVPVVSHGKAPCAGNGRGTLVKHCNAAVGHHRNARRVGLSASMATFRLLQRTTAIHCETRLAMNTDRPTEPININLVDH